MHNDPKMSWIDLSLAQSMEEKMNYEANPRRVQASTPQGAFGNFGAADARKMVQEFRLKEEAKVIDDVQAIVAQIRMAASQGKSEVVLNPSIVESEWDKIAVHLKLRGFILEMSKPSLESSSFDQATISW